MLDRPLIMLINNEPTFRWTISQLLFDNGFAVDAVDRRPDAVDHACITRPGAIVIEASYGSALSATNIVERLRAARETRYIPVIVCSPDGKFLNSYGEYLRGQGCTVIGRPFNGEQFVELLQRVAPPASPLVAGGLQDIAASTTLS
jgi:CheY-like chemotaxis protein